MEFDNHNEIPDWDFRKRFREGESGEGWKREPVIRRAELLYAQAREVYRYAKLFCESLKGEMAASTRSLIMQNAGIIPTKIIGAESGDLYMVRMENASIIRTNCRQLIEQLSFAEMTEMCNADYTALMKAEMGKFRLLFVDWVSHFEKDEFEDEWGLY